MQERWRAASAPKQEHLWLPKELLQQAQLLLDHKRQLDILSPQNQNQTLARQQGSLVLSSSARPPP